MLPLLRAQQEITHTFHHGQLSVIKVLHVTNVKEFERERETEYFYIKKILQNT